MPDDASSSERIIIDEDWKSQVEAERAALRRQREASAAEGQSPNPAVETGPAAASQPERAVPQYPPASFSMLITSLATEAMVALGQIPHPGTGKVETDLATARYLIDTLGILEAKTAGNRDSGESELLDSVLHQLRMAFVVLREQPTSGSAD